MNNVDLCAALQHFSVCRQILMNPFIAILMRYHIKIHAIIMYEKGQRSA